MSVLLVSLPYSEFRVYPADRICETSFPDGAKCLGTREPTQANIEEAADQGYTGEDAVWQCLVDHELLHSLVSDWLWRAASPTLRHEAGAERVPYGIRLYEEALVIAFQKWLNTGEVWPALGHMVERLTRWRARFTDAMTQIQEAA